MSRLEPPSGVAPPAEAYHSDGTRIDLQILAGRVCDTYRREFPDEKERYGEAGVKWCLHDNQYLFAWAIQGARDHTVLLLDQVKWLADILGNRGFPLERLARNLEIAAQVARDSTELAGLSAPTSEALQEAAKLEILSA